MQCSQSALTDGFLINVQLGMTKEQMQTAGREEAASEDAAFAASILCTRTSTNANLVRRVHHLSILDSPETLLLRWRNRIVTGRVS